MSGDEPAGVVVGLYGPAHAPQRLLAQLEDGRRVVIAVLGPAQAEQIGDATRGLLAPRSRSDRRYLDGLQARVGADVTGGRCQHLRHLALDPQTELAAGVRSHRPVAWGEAVGETHEDDLRRCVGADRAGQGHRMPPGQGHHGQAADLWGSLVRIAATWPDSPPLGPGLGSDCTARAVRGGAGSAV
ncbi:hypothetical protein OG455_36975 [Kitasatospora sp. NBC_01287]|uniref:hypothetical protein n=1 Tax=Kitasatospora sp. NBC_01287 TaxID=2903573 RepID=UPI0022574C61|nr:hypothetical protein [Kitasatospora sp. NBC_01287]MCX4751036.1 hypothetical protein [Kitasatospora sp. NBC_01287]